MTNKTIYDSADVGSPNKKVTRQPLTFSELPSRTVAALQGFMKGADPNIDKKVDRFRDTPRREPDQEGSTETFGGVQFTHRFVETYGDRTLVRYHVVESGSSDGEPVILLHGIPASWYQWWHVMAALPKRFRAIAIDLKGYGQSDKRPGDYSYAGTASELMGVLDALGVSRFNIVAHDRGVLPADHIAAKYPFRLMRYVRGEQHLAHYNPMLSPQEYVFAKSEPMRDPVTLVVQTYQSASKLQIADEDLKRTIQEYSFTGIADAVPRYFNGSSFTQEWIERRTKLMSAWRSPILIIQGRYSDAQPHELYEDAFAYIPNADSVEVKLIDAGHFWPLENPKDASDTIATFLDCTPPFDAEAWVESVS